MIVDHHLRELLDSMGGGAIYRQLSEIDLGHVDNCDMVHEILGILIGDVSGNARPDSGRLAAFGLAEILWLCPSSTRRSVSQPGRTTETPILFIAKPPRELRDRAHARTKTRNHGDPQRCSSGLVCTSR